MTAREPRRDRVSRDAYLLVELAHGRLQAELDAACASEGLSAAQYPVLWVLCLQADPEGLALGSIADGLVNRAPDVSRLVTRMEEAGLVERRRTAQDARVVKVVATPRGRRAFESATSRVKALHREQFDGLDDADLDLLVGLLNRVFWRGVEATQEEAS